MPPQPEQLPAVGFADTWTLNVAGWPTVKSTWSGLTKTGGPVEMNVNDCVAVWSQPPKVFLAVIVNVVVALGSVGVPVIVAVPSGLAVKLMPPGRVAGLTDSAAVGCACVVTRKKAPPLPLYV